MLFLSEADVAALLPMPKAIDLMREAFRGLADRTSQNQPRRRLILPAGSILHQLAGAHGKYFGAKLYSTHALHGAHFVVVLYDAETARPLAILEANHLGQIRTGAASGLATDLLARKDVRALGVIGSGFQAETQVEAVLAVRPIERIKVWSRTGENRHRFAEECSRRFGVPTAAVVSAEESVSGADVVITATSAGEPVFEAGWVKPGAHINAAGSNHPQRRELPAEILEAASLIAVDSLEQARLEAGDLLLGMGEEFWKDSRVVELSSLGESTGAIHARLDRITIFKSVGLGVEDIAAAGFLYEEALRAGKGQDLPLFQA